MTLATPEWGSDVIAAMLRRLEVPYVALNPGASYRGLHDSIVNYLGNGGPEILLCQHEEVAVDIAHGYAKVTGRAMGAILHANIGLLHAAMPIFTAFADRSPVLVMGATGPWDATKRRPWIDWLHTSNGQGGVIRDFVKWETQPGSVRAWPEALLRAWQVANTEPHGPVYVCFDTALQEERIAGPLDLPDPAAYAAPARLAPDPAAVRDAARLLVDADRPVILVGTTQAWADLIALAEALGAPVLNDVRAATSFPSSHPLSGGTSDDADAVLLINRTDGGSIPRAPGSTVINVSLEPYALRSWSFEFDTLPPATISIAANSELTIAALLEEVRRELRDRPERRRLGEDRLAKARAAVPPGPASPKADRPISHARLFATLRETLGDDRARDVVLAHLPPSYSRTHWPFERPGAYIGMDGGAAVGSGPGLSVGAALAVRDAEPRLVVSVMGDGNFAMAPTAVWTAVHHKIPLLFIIQNNQTYRNDEEHQRRVAEARGRPAENAYVGQRMTEPAVDFAMVARGFGAEGFGRVEDPAELSGVLRQAIDVVDHGGVALVDVRMV